MPMAERLSDDQVRHVAALGRLKLDEQQVAQFAQQLSAVLHYVSQLSELDVDSVEPLAHALDVTNVLRDDDPDTPLPVDQVLANAPQKSGPFFRVVKVLGDASGA